MRKNIFLFLSTVILLSIGVKLSLTSSNQSYSQFLPNMREEDALKLSDIEAENLGFEWNTRSIKLDYEAEFVRCLGKKLTSNSLDEFEKKHNIFPLFWKITYNNTSGKELKLFLSHTGKLFTYIKPEPENSKILNKSRAKAVAIKELKKLNNFNEQEYVESWYQTVAQENSGKVNRVTHYFKFTSVFKLCEASVEYKIAVTGDEIYYLFYNIQVPDTLKKEYNDSKFWLNLAVNITTFIDLITILSLFLLYPTFGRKRKLMKFSIISTILLIIFLPNLSILSTDISTIKTFGLELFLIIFCGIALDEEAFPKHISLRTFFKSSFIASKDYVSSILTGYFLASVLIVFSFLFFLVSEKYFGFYMYTDLDFLSLMLGNLNSFKSNFFDSTIISLYAGIKEEILFRAIFISIVALLYKKYNKRIILILLISFQAIFFGLAHSTYPVVPFYFKILSTLPMSFLFAYIFYRYGLLIPLVAHWFLDLFALTLFKSSVSTKYVVFISSLMLFSLIPFLLHVYFRYYKKVKEEVILNEDIDLLN